MLCTTQTSKKINRHFLLIGQLFLLVFGCLCLVEPSSAAPGRLDLRFPQILASGADVTTIELQADGKILVAGKFNVRAESSRRDLIRLESDGRIDPTFNFTGTDNTGRISFVKVQTNGKILIAGSFNQANNQFVRAIARLNADGSIDNTFVLNGIDVTFVNDLDIQTDGKILISASNLIGSSFVTRLNPDGTNQPGFATPLFRGNINSYFYRVTFSPTQNKILIGGNFTHIANGQTQYKNLIQLNLDGTVDTSLSPVLTTNAATLDLVVNAKPLDNGKILLWGKFETVNGTPRRNLAVISSSGSLDTAFNPALTGIENLSSVAVESTGKIIIGGSNFPSNTLLRGHIARLNADGSLDSSFNQGKGGNAAVKSVKIRSGNKLLVGGVFSRYQFIPRSGLAQLDL